MKFIMCNYVQYFCALKCIGKKAYEVVILKKRVANDTLWQEMYKYRIENDKKMVSWNK